MHAEVAAGYYFCRNAETPTAHQPGRQVFSLMMQLWGPIDGAVCVNTCRRSSARAGRRRTAQALHALRHDREHLLGTLPPSVTAQVR